MLNQPAVNTLAPIALHPIALPPITLTRIQLATPVTLSTPAKTTQPVKLTNFKENERKRRQQAIKQTVDTSVNQIGGFVKTAGGILQMAGATAVGTGLAHKLFANAPRARGAATLLITASIAALGFDALQSGVKQMILNKKQASVKDHVLEYAADGLIKPNLMKLGLSEQQAGTAAHGAEMVASIGLSLLGSSGGFHLIEDGVAGWMGAGRAFNHLAAPVINAATTTPIAQRGIGFMLSYGAWEAFEHLGVPALSNPTIQQKIADQITQSTTQNA